MADIRPFRGLRFAASAGPLADLVAPPYDVLSQEERDALAARAPHNVVHLTLPEQKSDDRSKYVKYARSAAALAEWRREGALALEDRPAFYRYVQTFHVPGSSQTFRRTAIIALIKVEPYEKGVVLPHEQTFPKHKEDRLRILEATRSHLECIYGLFEDPDGGIFALIEGQPSEELAAIETGDVTHELYAITDPDACAAISQALAPNKVWIADGHHRYETACNFRAALGEREGLVPEDFMMMALSSMSDPGLALLPTHRILRALPGTADEALAALRERFAFADSNPESLWADVEKGGEGTFGLALADGRAFTFRPHDTAAMVASLDGGGELLRSLDVTLLHRVVLDQCLGVKGLDGIAYTRDPNEAIQAVAQSAAASFLMNPPSVDQMRQIALGGEKMPQKSTYYYPKLLSGLVLWSLNDYEP